MNVKRFNIYQLKDVLTDCQFQGDGDGWVSSVSTINDADAESMAWLNPTRSDKFDLLQNTKSNCVFVGDSDNYISRNGQLLISCKSPRLIYAKILNDLLERETIYGVHPTAVVDARAVIGEKVYIGPYSVVDECEIGEGCVISSNCKIGKNTRIGKNVKISSGTVIGSDGFGFVKDTDGRQLRFPHVGGVIIEDDVEIGANSCIDKGTLGFTIIKKGAKVDNLVHIAHNVEVGNGTMIAANAMIGGSTVIGDDVWIAPSVTLRDGLNIGALAFIGLGAMVTKSVPEGELWAGVPAKFIRRV